MALPLPLWAALSVGEIGMAFLNACLVFLLGLLALYLLVRRALPALLLLAQEDPLATSDRKIRLGWIGLTFLAPLWVFGGGVGLGPYLPFKVVAALGFFLAVYVGMELALLAFVQPLLKRVLRVSLSAIFKDLLRIAVYALAVVGIVQTVFGVRNLGTLVAISSAASIIVGLALQDTLGNVFAGLFLQIDRPINIGDWVNVEGEEGKVIEITWYSTKILTEENLLISIPNRRVSMAVVRNLSRPAPLIVIRRRIGVADTVPPNRVRDAVLRQVLDVPGVLKDPAPTVSVAEYGDSAIHYEVSFWIGDPYLRRPITNRVLTAAWYALNREGIELGNPVRMVYERSMPAPPDPAETRPLLRNLDFLAPLAAAEQEELSRGLGRKLFGRGEPIIRQGEPGGDTLYIILRGSVEVRAARDGEGEVTLARLSKGQCFGEMSLLTGEARSATVVALEDTEVATLDRAGFGRVLSRNPAVLERISEIVARRVAATRARFEEHDKEQAARPAPVETERRLYDRVLAGLREILKV